jgi:aspartyl/glutamyl-tRNA(Asn/Gln) amidotransferase C subunit
LDELRHLADLSQLYLDESDPETIKKTQHDVDAIISWCAHVQRATLPRSLDNLPEILPMISPLEQLNVALTCRKDEVTETPQAEKVLSNAKNTDANYFILPKPSAKMQKKK